MKDPYNRGMPIASVASDELDPRGGTQIGRTQVVVLAEDRYLAQAQPSGLAAALAARGVYVSVVDADRHIHDLRSRPPLAEAAVVVARGRSMPLITALGVVERFGARTVNRSTAIAAVRDKAAMAAALAAAGVPTPATWVGPPAELARSISSAAYPLLLKPVFGDNCRGIRHITGPRELATMAWPEKTAVAQSFMTNDGTDVKVYAVGNRRWAVRVPSPLEQHSGSDREPQHMPLDPELDELGSRCGDLFGLELFGVDCLLTPAGYVVVEVNDFPNYRGVPGADDALADHVLSQAGTRP